MYILWCCCLGLVFVHIYCSRFAQNLLPRVHISYILNIRSIYVSVYSCICVLHMFYMRYTFHWNAYLSIHYHYDDTYMLDPVLHMYLWLRDNGPLPRRQGLTSFMIYVYSRPYQQAIVYIWLKDNCPPSTTTIYIVYYYIHPILHTVVVWLRHDFFSHKCICFGCAIYIYVALGSHRISCLEFTV